MKTRITVLALLCGAAMSPAFASSVSTSFSTADGFVTGGTADVTLSNGPLNVTISGGQQQQMFDFPSYNSGPDGYLFINGPSFTGTSGKSASGTGDKGLIDFNIGATAVSFYAANRANGAATTIRVFGVDDKTVLTEVAVAQTDISAGANPELTSFDYAALGGLIGSIEIDNPGPAGQPPYVTAIDNLTVSAVPIPAALPLLGSAIAGLLVARRKV